MATVKANLANRTAKARALAKFAQVVERDGNGVVKVTRTPGTKCKSYKQVIRRFPAVARMDWDQVIRMHPAIVRIDCWHENGGMGNTACKGNERTVCYHSMASIIAAADCKGLHTSFCANGSDAAKLAQLSGTKPTRIVNRSGSGEVWAVCRK